MQKYSVLMTVFKNDVPDYFELSLNSMLGQTHMPDEIVIVKDGPIPSSLQEVIDSAKIKFKSIVEVSLPENIGLGLALNEGIKVCNNELIARMDADDFSLPNRCELQVMAFERNPDLDIIGSSVDEFVGTIDNVVAQRLVPISNEEIYQFSKRRDPFNHPTVMYRKSILEKVGGYSDYRKNQDTDLWIKLLSAGAICENLTETVFKFRFDEKTFEKRKNWLNTKILIEIRYKAWKNGFNSFLDFLSVAVTQICIYLLPVKFQKFLYSKFLRN